MNSYALTSESQPLSPESLPLTGCHLIEASAGTGKTFNITRIYLRLLLERKLDVKNILVMTFTRAATEELRARIANEIRNALDNWGQFDPNDSFFASLTQQFTLQDVYPALHNALLHLDEAAIFTIHSFCKRVLSQQAFSSGIAFNIQMETDTADIELEAVRDWYRIIAKQKSTENEQYEPYKLLTQNWLTPESFRQAFREVLSSTITVQANSPEQIKDNFQKLKSMALQHLQNNQTFIFAELIDSHKQKDIRAEEWNDLVRWLSSNYFVEQSSVQEMPKSASSVFNGNRYGKKAPEIKEQLNDAFNTIKQLKSDAATIEASIKKSQSYLIAAQGIEAIRAKITQAKQRSKVMNYDDLINQLASALTVNDDSSYHPLADLIKNQYPVALVDEFQDTDPNQYAILKAIYHSNTTSKQSISDNLLQTDSLLLEEGTGEVPSALYMIGDPKQAIYAFRSGDVFTYLAARDDADQQWVMDTNWRSSTQMINAYNRLFYGAPLDKKAEDIFGFNIQYTPVKSAGQADKNPLTTYINKTDQINNKGETDNNAALQLIHFPFNEAYRQGRSKKEEMNQSFCTVIASWCASEIHNLLLDNNSQIGDKTLQEQDIAILVRDKKEAAYIQDALRTAGYPSVYLSTHDNVFFSEEAIELERALYGILELENDRLLVAALSTRFLGCDTEKLFALQEEEDQWENHREQAFDLRESWLKRGFMAMALKLLHQNFMPQPEHHERSLTNAIQLLELLQQASQRHRQPEQLLNWLREQIEAQSAAAEAELRLESDANLIRIITQHGSKGLEYPVVFIPFATRYKDPAKFGSKNIDLYKYHDFNSGSESASSDENESYQLNYFIGQDKRITDLYREEAWAESIRLLYVAVTRAEHRCYLCATPFNQFYFSPLGQTLKLSSSSDLLASLTQLLDPEPGSDKKPKNIHLQAVNDIDFSVNHSMAAENKNEEMPAQFTGRIERNWWLSSFSALTRNLRHGGISTPDHDQDAVLHQKNIATGTENEIRFSLTKGAATGNLLHDILEHTDFSQAHWQRSLERPLSRFNETLDETQQSELIDWLEACLDTPLELDHDKTNQSSIKLNELTWSQTLRETEFYFPMEQVKPHLLGLLLTKHRQQRLNQDDVQAHRVNPIQLPGNKALQGMMHGFIDLIFESQGKYYIVDYKSTHLGNRLDDYEHSALEKNVRNNYYDLQYLLYSLALHRYLKSRKTDYDPEQHFGGIHYLYLRGMSPDSDSSSQAKRGIFSTPISPELLNELDELFSDRRGKNSLMQVGMQENQSV